MQPIADSFQALARSSPWRWRTLHLTRHAEDVDVEGWVRRPGELVVRRPGEPDHYEHELLGSADTSEFWATSSIDPNYVPPPRPPSRWPHQAQPLVRPDGLVAERPDDPSIVYGDPLYGDYTWVAMLDPHELSHDVSVDRVAVDEVHGREVWRARVRPDAGYDPHCPCCPLLPSAVQARKEYAHAPDRLARIDAIRYPDSFEVVLDVQTGVVVDITPIGGDASHDALSVDIHEVDADLDAVFTPYAG